MSNWADGCAPDSPLRLIEMHVRAESPPQETAEELTRRLRAAYRAPLADERSYIYDHPAAMDLCQHPELMPLHGLTTSAGQDAGPLVPLFTFAKSTVHSDILVTPLEQYSPTYIGQDPDWERKPLDKLMWRGSTTGVNFFVENPWRDSQRARLHFDTHEMKGEREVLVAEGDEEPRVVTYPLRNLNTAMMDMSFSGKPVQCDDETCKIMEKVIDFKPTMGLDEAYQVSIAASVPAHRGMC